LDITGARDAGVAVASAGPYANHLHLAPSQYLATDVTTKVKFGSKQTSKPNNCKNNLKELIKPAVT